MSAEKDWLAMLDKATNYAELQSAFARMSTVSRATDDGDAMVASIDEAIRRIEQERARDQTELDAFSSDYESFKQEQSGVIGWFKRKMPFTETHKQELGHRDAINDQAAEILADNFIIARAQILKERIASPRLRRMGYEPSKWREEFLNSESVNSIGDYGKVVFELGQELSAAKLFVEKVKVDIDAFSAAKFVNKEDQVRSTEDLKAAQGELKTLMDESHAKVNLHRSALATLKGLLISELSGKDSDFRDAIHRLAFLKDLQDNQPRLANLLDERLKNLKVLVAKTVERDAIPEQREKLVSEIDKLKGSWDEAERVRLRAAGDLEGPSQLYNAALAEAQQSKAALNAAKPFYDVYVADQNRSSQNLAEVASESDFEVSPSSVVMEYRRLEEAVAAAIQKLNHMTPPFEHATRIHDSAFCQTKSIHDKSEARSLELNKLTYLESEIQQQLLKAKQSIESTFPEFRIAAGSYLNVAGQITWTVALVDSIRAIQAILDNHATWGSSALPGRLANAFPAHSTSTVGLPEIQRHVEHTERAIQAIEACRKACVQEISTLAHRRNEAILRRGQMLLDQSVLAELDLE